MAKIPVLNAQEIEKMARAGQIAAELKALLREKARPGTETRRLNDAAESFLQKQGSRSAFKGYQNFPAAIITCLNEELVHSIPGRRKLTAGDILTIDLGAVWQEYFSDTADTFVVGGINSEEKFLAAGRRALNCALSECRAGRRVGDISRAIQSSIESAGYNVVRDYTGHGIGHALHQEPEIPCFIRGDVGERLQVGMALAVEVMYTAGAPLLKIRTDGWTAVTADGKLSAHFEETIIVGSRAPQILTSLTDR